MLKLNNICRNYPNVTQLLETALYDKRRKMENMSQYALAERIGVSRNCIQQMECHEHIPKAETVFDMIRALDFDEDEKKDFLTRYFEAYERDKAFQQEQELAGTV